LTKKSKKGSVYERRISKLQKKLKKKGIDSIIITTPQNIQYLTGFAYRDKKCEVVLVTLDKVILIIHVMYKEDVKYEEDVKTSIAPSCEIMIYGRKKNLWDSLAAKCNDLNLSQVGFESRLIYEEYKMFSRALSSNIEHIETDGLVEDLRTIKDASEIENLRKAAQVTDQVFSEIIKIMKPGMKECEVAAEMEYMMVKMDAKKADWETIVASGERSAFTHGFASQKKIKAGDLVTLDFGCIYNGYTSDMTRTVVIGKKPTSRQKKIYQIVKEAEMKAMEAVKPGVSGKKLGSIARGIIKAHHYGKRFTHGLGHAIGIEVHEKPCPIEIEESLKAGMVITIEPGIYILGWGGVRIEDDILITKNGYELLTHSSRDLIVIE